MNAQLKEILARVFNLESTDIINDTFDLGRLMKCCNQYPQADGRLLPICAQNNMQY